MNEEGDGLHQCSVLSEGQGQHGTVENRVVTPAQLVDEVGRREDREHGDEREHNEYLGSRSSNDLLDLEGNYNTQASLEGDESCDTTCDPESKCAQIQPNKGKDK